MSLLPVTLFTESAGVGDADEAPLTPLQRAQLDAALAYHSLVNPGSELEVRVTVGAIDEMPILTDARCERGWEGLPSTPLCTVTGLSSAVGAATEGVAGGGDAPTILRNIRISHPEASPATTRPAAPQSLPRRAYDTLERTAPEVTDAVRETIMRRRESAISSPLPRYPNAEGDAEIETLGDAYPEAHTPPENAPKAVLFGLHWLQTGGAERWAVESIQLAKDAGFTPVVVTDHNSVHPWLTRAELDGCVVVALSSDDDEPPLDAALARAVAENFDLVGAVVHHSDWLYRSLPLIRNWRPEVPVVDSLHIVEYLGGGYPGVAVRFDRYIDTHHTISPELDRWLVEVQRIDAAKIALAPLAGLTVDASGEFAPRVDPEVFTVAYVGRLSRQKRPDVFLGLVHRLVQQGTAVRAVLHGDGELFPLVDALIARYRLGDIVELRHEDTPVADTLAESDLLVLTSINEGLTLTTFEAVAAGIPVLSTDVGSQRTIVQGELLLPRPARPFSRAAAAEVLRLARFEQDRERLWRGQRDRVAGFSGLPGAGRLFEEWYRQWQQ